VSFCLSGKPISFSQIAVCIYFYAHMKVASTPAKTYRKLKTLQLIAVIFLTVSGGPYGLEPLLVYAGRHGALLLLLVTPFLWDIPAILTVLELNSMMPVEGGYYQWVKRGLGLRWAFFEGWWTWLYTFVDLAIYPVLFVEYASFFFPQIEAYKIPVCLCIIWFGAILNIIGIVPVGGVATVLGIIVIIPFVILFGITIYKDHGHFVFPGPSLKGISLSSLGLALYTVIWNFIGWDNATTYAGEVDKPIKAYIKATAVVFVLILLIYTSAIIAALQSGIDMNVLSDEGFPAVGSLLGGYSMGALISLGGMCSAVGLFCAILLSVSRVPKVMADDKLLPNVLDALHPRFQTPYRSIILCALVVSIMIIWSFADLLIIDVTVYGAGLFLEYIALIMLRIKAPDEHRPFKIPLNIPGLVIMALVPLIIYSIALIGAFSESGNNIKPALFAIAALLSSEVVWLVIKRVRGKKLSYRNEL